MLGAPSLGQFSGILSFGCLEYAMSREPGEAGTMYQNVKNLQVWNEHTRFLGVKPGKGDVGESPRCFVHDSPPEIRRLAVNEGLNVTGYVPDHPGSRCLGDGCGARHLRRMPRPRIPRDSGFTPIADNPMARQHPSGRVVVEPVSVVEMQRSGRDIGSGGNRRSVESK